MPRTCALSFISALIVTGVALISGNDLPAVSWNFQPIAQPGGEPDERKGVSKSSEGFEQIAAGDESSQLRKHRFSGADRQHMGGVMADQNHGTGVHQLAHQRGAVVAQPEGFPIGALFPKVEQTHIHKLSCEVSRHRRADGAKGQALNFEKCGFWSAVEARHESSEPQN